MGRAKRRWCIQRPALDEQRHHLELAVPGGDAEMVGEPLRRDVPLIEEFPDFLRSPEARSAFQTALGPMSQQ